MGYLEYYSWLQQAVPESLPESPEMGASEEQDEFLHLSGLQLLRKLNEAARPKVRPRVPKLKAEELALANDGLWGDGSSGEVLASRFSVDLTRGQLQCLRPGEWLNDEVINFYYKLLQERSNMGVSGGLKCWFPNSFFWPKLSGKNSKEYSYKEVRRWTIKAKVDIFQLECVVFPMNIGETHWAMGAIDLRARGFRYFDSMLSRPPPNFVAFLRRYVGDEHSAKKGRPLEGVDEWELLPAEGLVPQQRNGYDCGVFTCCFGEYFSESKPFSFDQADMPDLRLRLAARVMQADENWDNDS
jgi:Ulp1 family protease